MKQKLIYLLILMTVVASIPIQAFALVVGNTGTADIVVTEMNFSVNNFGYAPTGGYIEIFGQNLQGVDVLFNMRQGYSDTDPTGGFKLIGTRSIDSNFLIQIQLTAREASYFEGTVAVGNERIQLPLANFPIFRDSNVKVVNQDDPAAQIIFSGNNLDKLNQGTITGTYGVGTQTNSLGTTALSSSLTLNNPVTSFLGPQSIFVSQTTTLPESDNIEVNINYEYTEAFRIIQDLGLENVSMYPNTGAKGDEVYITGENFGNKNYQVYFVKNTDGTDPLSSINKAQFVSLSDDDTIQTLTVKVPTSTLFERRNYYVLITEVRTVGTREYVIAEHYIKKTDGTGVFEEFTVIQADFKPRITNVYPSKGPDTGGNVEINGTYLISLNIPDLQVDGGYTDAYTDLASEELTIVYDSTGATYKNEPVEIQRNMNIQIGGKVKFQKDSNGDPLIVQSATDQINVITGRVTDADTDPFKDVIIEMQTIITGQTTGKVYTFNQIVTLPNGYEFEPSTYTPVIDTVLPNMVQIEDTATSYSKIKADTLIAITGSLFMVDRFVDADGTVITRKPTVLVKKNDNNTANNRYQLAFFPNEEFTNPDGSTVRGIIKYKPQEDAIDALAVVLKDENGYAIPLEMTVLNGAGEVVTGIAGNQLGTKILIRIPNQALIEDGGIKHIQVTNPTRKSPDYGNAAIKSDIIEFVTTTDIPVIESVVPSIVTVEGGEEIVITGSNLQNGMRLFLDGTEITNFTRELDTTGNKIIVTFTAPPGREGTTQLSVMNPSGGIAVSAFSYVKTFNQNPILDNFTPKQGTAGTLVVVNGDNFLTADPTAVTEAGIDAYRLIGSRILLDGKDVNTYRLSPSGEITFGAYSVPDADALNQKDGTKAIYSKFKENTTVSAQVNGEDIVAQLTNDAQNNPAIKLGTETYAIRGTSTGYQAYNAAGTLVGQATITFAAGTDPGTGTTTIAIANGPTFVAQMDNRLARIGTNPEALETVYLANYANSVTLKSLDSERFTLTYNFAGDPILTNGRDKTYTLRIDNGEIVAQDALGFKRPLAFNSNGVSLDGNQLNMITPYIVDDETGYIEGNRSTVLSKNQITFRVPTLTTGRGYKDLTVINPDTKSDSKTDEQGFYYISQATSNPVITTIEPSKGSVDGGYYVTISGSDFEDDIKVYVDSVEVPKADTYVDINGKYIIIKMPKSIKNLNQDYGVDALDVPIVVVNPDGGSAWREKGFTYIIPTSTPTIDRIIPTGGSANGGEIVEIIGYEFRFYEPYENSIGDTNYDLGDKFEDLYINDTWDDLLSPTVDPGALQTRPEETNPYYDTYYVSPILPKVYFGENEAKIVEFSRGYLKVITPQRTAGQVDVYVINNDSGVSNKQKYTYTATNPVISSLVPAFGRRQGQEPKDIYGSKLYRSQIYGYANDDPTGITLLDNVDARIRFGNITNRNIDRVLPNSGLINNQRTSVSLEGGLDVIYRGDSNEVQMTLTENNTIYSRTFDYNGETVYVPVGMLKSNAGNYYVPQNLRDVDPESYSGNAYEYIRLEIADRRLIVERGYAPEVVYDNEYHVAVYTPSYYSIGNVQMTYFNNDGGSASRAFTYTNPDSSPQILTVEPKVVSYSETAWFVEASVSGGVDIEIIGNDFREGVKVFIGPREATVKELTTKIVDGVEYDLIVANVPQGTDNDIEEHYPIMIQNEDRGLASSANLSDLIGESNYQDKKLPIYFVYKKPLSGPRIDTVSPAKTSVAGGNTITLTGADFREGAYVIIGTRAGIPITDVVISERGTKLTFKTPKNMTLGPKTIQVLNNDYGIAVKQNGITVVSAPTLSPVITDVDGNTLNRIHVTGGQEIILKGTGFAPNARVYFGGEWITVRPADNIPETEHGIYKDDSIHYVKEGTLAQKVEFIDENTLKVTTPEVLFEGEIAIVVRNADGGTTDDAVKLEYTVPIPMDPRGLKITVVDDQYIKLYDYEAENAQYFEIYVYMGIKTDSELVNAGYRDFQYLGITNIEPYKLTELPGLENRSSAERIVFVLKGVNKFGPSGYSNLAALTHEDLKNVDEIGPTDSDGDLKVPTGETHLVDVSGNLVKVDLADRISLPSLTIDLKDRVTTATTLKRVVMPEALIQSGMTSITVDTGQTLYRFTPVSFNTQTFKSLANYYDVYGRLTENTGMDGSRAYLTPNIRGKKAISKVFSIGFDVSGNEDARTFQTLSGTMDVTFNYNPAGLTLAKELQVQLYKYNLSTGTYQPVQATLDTNLNRVTARINEAGHYVLMTNY